jgi:hypothetical protein
MLFLSGVQLIGIGVLGEYVGRLFDEVKGRPIFLVQEEINFARLSRSPADLRAD